jgi:ABC-type nitrate/sulfonate/bicarbonate transport system, permease component
MKNTRSNNESKGNLIFENALMFMVPLLIIIIWEISGWKKLINVSVLPMPSTIWQTILDMLQSGELLKHIGVSLLRVMEGYIIGSFLGVLIGILMGLVRKLNKAFALIVEVLRPIPVIAWVPVLILWLGIGEISKVTVIAIGTFWPVLLNTIHGIKATDRKCLEVAEILEKRKSTVLAKIILPSALPAIFTGFRIGLGNAWACVIGAELIAAASGVGYLISYAREVSQPDVMFVGVFSIGIIGLLIDIVIKKIEAATFKWKNDIL